MSYADEISVKLSAKDEMSAKLAEARKELTKLEREMRTARTEVQNTGAPEAVAELRKLEKAWDKASDKQQDLKRQLAEARKALTKTAAKTKEVTAVVKKDTAVVHDNVKVVGRADGAWKRLGKSLGGAAAKVTHLDKRLAKVNRQGGKGGGLSKLGMAGAAAATGVGLAAAATGAGAYALLGMTKAAMKDEAGQKKLAGQLKTTTGASEAQIASLETWITKQGEATGIADDEMRPALARLADSFGSIGKSKEMTKLAMDIATAKGKKLSDVSNAMAKAQDGNVTALKKLGITLGPQAKNLISYQAAQKSLTTAQSNAATALQQYGPKSKQYATAMDKVATKQREANNLAKGGIDVFGELGKQFGGQTAEHAKTLEGRMARLSTIFSETKESIGGAFIPVATTLAETFQDKVLPVLRRLGTELLPKVRDVFDSVKKAIADNRPGLERLGAAFKAAGGIVIKYVLPWLIKLQGKIWVTIINMAAKLGDALVTLAPLFLDMAAVAVDSFKAVADSAFVSFSGILTIAEKTMGWIPGLGDKIRGAKTAFDGFKDKTSEALDKVSAGLRKAGDKVREWDKTARRAQAAKIRGNIDDLSLKITKAKNKLRDPKLTKPEAAKIRGDLTDLKAKLGEAKRDLAAVPNVVPIAIKVTGTAAARATLNKISRLSGGEMTVKLQTFDTGGGDFASGGRIRGPGTDTSDSIRANVSRDEFVVRAAAARTIGYDQLEALNWADRNPAPAAIAVRQLSPSEVSSRNPQPAYAAPSGPSLTIGTINTTSDADVEGHVMHAMMRAERIKNERQAGGRK